MTLPGTPAWAVFSAWFGLVAAEAGTWCLAGRLCSKGSHAAPPGPAVAQKRPAADAEETADAEIPVGLVQQITRIRRDGAETVHIVIQAEVPRGERLAVIHLAFCPPLDVSPELEAHAIDADDAEVRIALAETFGARLEVRLPHAATTVRQVLVEVLGSAAVPARRSRGEAG
jgi:hypothetical protein